MGMGQLNPMRTIAPQQTVSTSALASILGNQGKAIQGIGKGLTGLGDTAGEFGRQQNTSKLTDLIARSQIDDLGADEIRNIASDEGIDTSRLTDSGSKEFAKLIERKDAFAKTKGGVILKDGTFKSLTGEEGVVPEDVRDDVFYAGWKSPDKTFDRALQGTTLQNRKTLIDGYLDGQTSAKELFKNDNKGVPRSSGFTFMYKNKPITAVALKDELAKQNAIVNNPSETPIKKEQAKLEVESIEQTVAEQNNIEEQNSILSRLTGQDNSTKVTSISNQDSRFSKPTMRDLLMGKQDSVSKDSTSANALFNGTNNGKASEVSQSLSKEIGLPESDVKNIIRIESGGKGYEAENESGAFGKYQIMPETAKELSKELNIPLSEWKKPRNQDKMFTRLTLKNKERLAKRNLPTDAFHLYGAHQQGVGGLSQILKGNISEKVARNIRANIPKDKRHLTGKALANAWIDRWKKEFI